MYSDIPFELFYVVVLSSGTGGAVEQPVGEVLTDGSDDPLTDGSGDDLLEGA